MKDLLQIKFIHFQESIQILMNGVLLMAKVKVVKIVSKIVLKESNMIYIGKICLKNKEKELDQLKKEI